MFVSLSMLVAVQRALGAEDFAARQRSLQYKTWSQFLAQRFRQLMGRPQTRHGFWGKSCLFPLKPEGLDMGLFSGIKPKVTM
jgi:hypothetical protein